ncbi:MAG: transporter [Bacteroidetes bacterium 4572_77]|nr:MAG: transporter [Bacteroidetes bacterium 4572_77]
MNIIIAWRNIWRNKKRTFITISSVTLAVVLAIFMRSFQEGTYGVMIENAVGKFTGYVQVHQKDYWEDKTIDNGMTVSPLLLKEINSIPEIEGCNLRLESFSLASYQKNTKGTMIMGIEPEKEDRLIGLKSKMIKGEYIDAQDQSIILGSGLAKYLAVDVGDTMVLMGQGHWGQSAIGAYPIKGIIKMPSPVINKQIVFMPLSLARQFFSFDNGTTSIVVKINDPDDTDEIAAAINSKIDTTQYQAMVWQKMSPEVVQQIEGDKAGGIIMIAILYLIIAFGVFGTVLMMAQERKREFAVMVSIGMQKTKLMLISFYEAILMNSVGVLLGILLTIPIVIYYNINPITLTGEMAASMEQFGIEPILPTSLDVSIFINNTLIIIIITAIAAIYPLFTILKMNVIKSLRG